jgi:hypothetical protein
MNVFLYIAAFAMVALASARITRNLVYDDFPPTAALRRWWTGRFGEEGWGGLLLCPYCIGFWVALPFTVLGVGFLFGWETFATLDGLFWTACAWFAVGYLSGIIPASNWG